MKNQDKRNYHETTKNNIVKAARQLFSRYGFRKTTMEDIARCSERTKSSVYYYFSSKEDIFHAVAEQDIKRAREELEKIMDKEKSPSERMKAYIKKRNVCMHEMSSSYHFFEEEYFENYRLIKHMHDLFDREEIDLISGVLKDGVSKKVFRVESVKLTAENILNLLKGLEHIWLREKNAAGLEKKIDNLTGIILEGLIARR